MRSPGRSSDARWRPIRGAWRRYSPNLPGFAKTPRHRGNHGRTIIAGTTVVLWSAVVRGQLVAQSRAVGGDHASPDAVLADVPVPQRQLRALGAYRATGADGDRRSRLVAGPGWLDAGREPLVGIKTAVRAAGVPDDPGPQGIAGHRAGGKTAGHVGARLSGRSGAQAVAGSRGAPAGRPGASRRGRRRPGPAPMEPRAG